MSLIAWFPLNGNLTDYSSNGVNLTAYNALLSTARPKLNSCYAFNGNDSYLLINTILSNLYTSSFAISMWIYKNEINVRDVLYGDYGSSDNDGSKYNNFEVFSDNKLRYYWRSGTIDARSTIACMLSEKWQHVAVSYNADTQYLDMYCDAVRVYHSKVTLTGFIKTGKTYIGRDERTGASAFNGFIQDVRIYNNALSQREIKELYKLKILEYDFSNKAIDLSGFKNDGICSNVIQSTMTDFKTNSGQFRETNQSFISCPTTIKLEHEVSILARAYMANWADYSAKDLRLFSSTETGGINMYSDNGRIFFLAYDSGIGYKVAGTSILWSSLSSGWHTFACTFNGTIKGYLDGNLIATSDAFSSGKIGYNANNTMFIGAEAGGTLTTPAGNYFPGHVSNFRVYATCLNQSDIMEWHKKQSFIDLENSKIFGYEFVEQGTSISTSDYEDTKKIYLNKTGKIYCGFLDENNSYKAKMAKSKSYLSPNYLVTNYLKSTSFIEI